MSRIYLPSPNAEAWKAFLAKESHWRKGYSAFELAHAWQGVEGFPPEIASALDTAPPLYGVKLLLAFPEHKVTLPPEKGHPSQNDIWALGRVSGGLISIAVEGKVSESFGPTVAKWYTEPSSGKETRFAALKKTLGLPNIPGHIRYQLLHRAASAIIEANRFHARHAVMLVHSFSSEDKGFEDFAAFVKLFGKDAAIGGVVGGGGC